MKIHRFIGQFDFTKPKLIIDDPSIVHQLMNVLWIKVGDHIVLVSGDKEAWVQISQKDDRAITVEILEVKPVQSVTPLTLYCAILKRDNFEWVVQKATEVGVSNIVPIITARTIKKDIRLDRLQKIAQEAAEQSGAAMPTISTPQPFEEAISNAPAPTFFFEQSGQPIAQVLQEKKPTSIFIGPEGGWTSEELETAKQHNFFIVSLGVTTLRGETATIIASYLVCSHT